MVIRMVVPMVILPEAAPNGDDHWVYGVRRPSESGWFNSSAPKTYEAEICEIKKVGNSETWVDQTIDVGNWKTIIAHITSDLND